VKIDIPSVLVHLRARVVRESRLDLEEAAMKAAGRIFASRRAYERAQRLARFGRLPVGPLRAWAKSRELPDVPRRTFRDWWRDRE
jgi:L-lactate dehydrogenase complex protein LldF